MRNLHRALPLVLAVFWLGFPAAATADETDPKPPGYFVEHLVPSDDTMPKGWTIDEDARPPSGGPTEEELNALGESLGLDDEQFYVDYRLFKRTGSGEIVPVGMIDVEKKVSAFHAALKAKAAESGWQVRELGSPTRVLVVGGTEATCSELTEQLIEHTVYALSEIAMNRLRGRSGHEEAGRAAALEYVKAIRVLSPKAGTAYSVTGVVHWLLSLPKMPPKKGTKPKPDRAEQEKAVEQFAKGLESGVPFPPKGSVLVWTAGKLGGIILTWKDKGKLEQATRALELAVKHEKDAKSQDQRFSHRYNLSCAYARAGRIDEAFKTLKLSLEVLKIMPPHVHRAQHKRINEKDEDMRPLRRDPRFSKLMKQFKPPPEKKRKLPPNHPDTGKEGGG